MRSGATYQTKATIINCVGGEAYHVRKGPMPNDLYIHPAGREGSPAFSTSFTAGAASVPGADFSAVVSAMFEIRQELWMHNHFEKQKEPTTSYGAKVFGARPRPREEDEGTRRI